MIHPIQLAENGFLPDWVVRLGIRRLLSRRRQSTNLENIAAQRHRVADFADRLRKSSLAVSTDKANDQHYEVPAEFFRLVLGPRLKYSCCLYDSEPYSLADAEAAMLRLTCERAEIADGMEVLELGCGWGSLTLWMAEHYPNCRITAISNSHGQREFIESRCRKFGFDNVEVHTTDVCDFDTDRQFDRVVSVEMFEHLRNYELLLGRISIWLRNNGKLFVHIFCHRDSPYVFETDGAANWMGRHFFTGGMMPSADLLSQFQDDLTLQDQWPINGWQYARTCNDWLANLDRHRRRVDALFEAILGRREARVAVQRWRMFFMACEELFRYLDGDEWFVSHYRFENRAIAAAAQDGVSRTAHV